MFSRPHHQRIFKILSALDVEFLLQSECYFGGGTAIVMLLGEYRESLDIDFLCSSGEGYRAIRNLVFDDGLKKIFKEKITILGDVKSDQYGVRAVLEIDEARVKFEIIREGRIQLSGNNYKGLPVQALSVVDLFSEKLLANADRFNDEAVLSRDLIDLAMLIISHEEIPLDAWAKVKKAYGESVVQAFHKGIDFLSRPKYFESCCEKIKLDHSIKDLILPTLAKERAKL
jgi:Nucleotidyl transferase AbiEii toxin, Type IV TA system